MRSDDISSQLLPRPDCYVLDWQTCCKGKLESCLLACIRACGVSVVCAGSGLIDIAVLLDNARLPPKEEAKVVCCLVSSPASRLLN